jgi:hypothetical protein
MRRAPTTLCGILAGPRFALNLPALPRPSQPARLLLAVLVLLVVGALAWVLLSAADAALSVWQRLQAMPALLRWGFLGALAVLVAGGGWVAWRILHPRPRRAARAEPLDRSVIEARAEALGDDAAPARDELAELDRRRALARVHVALFGEVSAGKSSLLRALVPGAEPAVAASAGTTHAVSLAEGTLPGGTPLVVADVPGTNEAGGESFARMARAEAARAHLLLFVCDGDLARAQDAELRAIAAFGKPLLLVLNKRDRYDAAELSALTRRLSERTRALGARVLAVSAGGSEEVLLRRADGSEQRMLRPRPPDVAPLLAALERVAEQGPEALEPAREAAVLAGVEAELSAAERTARAKRSEETVRRYTRRAVIGALAAVAPGTDLVIQGALATGLVRELAAIHGVPVRDLDVDGFLQRAGGLLRTTTSVTLAVAGNALKAFPGLGTLGGGLLHAVAYGLIFDSLGRALAATMAETRALDREATLAAFQARLASPDQDRLQAVARLAWDAWRERNEEKD